MNRHHAFLSLLAALSLAFLLAACGSAPAPAPPEAQETEASEPAEVGEAGSSAEPESPEEAPVPDTSDQELLDLANGEILDQYNFAMYLAAGAVFEQDWQEINTDEDGMPWSRVTDSRVHSLADIETVWYTHFAGSSVIPDGMLDFYREIDGALWAACLGVGDNFTDIELTAVRERVGNTAVLTGDRIFDYGEGREIDGTIDCTMVWEDGAWRCREIALNGEPWGFARIP